MTFVFVLQFSATFIFRDQRKQEENRKFLSLFLPHKKHHSNCRNSRYPHTHLYKMISQLNTRLISSRVSTMTTSSVNNSGYASSGSDRSKSSNGYAADRSAQPSLTSHLKGSETSMKRSNDMTSTSSVIPPALKRLRTNYNNAELHYLASKAKEVMEQAGLVYPKLDTNTPRMFPPKSAVNMSGVSHKFSSQCDSPFLGPDATGNDVGHNYMGCPYEMNSLLQSTCSFYSLTLDTGSTTLPSSFSKVVQMMQQTNTDNLPINMNNNYEKEIYSDTESSTSSVTISDNGGGVNCRRSSKVQPHSDGRTSDSPLATFVKSTNNLEDQHPLGATATTSGAAMVTIGQALEISRRPRIITSAQAPYHIVQVNAAFLRLSNSKSTNDFLGKPLHECLQLRINGTDDDDDDDDQQSEHESVSLAAGLKSSYTTMQKVSVPGYPDLLRRQVATASASGNAANVHRVTIVPVGVPSKLDEAAKVTHFAIKISMHPTPKQSRPASTTSSSSSTTTSHLSNATQSNHQSDKTGAIHVMG